MHEWTDIALIAPAADIDLSTVAILREQLDALLESGARRILVSCKSVTFIDSSGLALLLSRARRAHQLGGLLSLADTSPALTRFLQIVQVIDVLHVRPAQREPLPVLTPGAMPTWSKSLAVNAGIEHLPDARRRVSELLEQLALSEADRFDTALAAGEALSNALDHSNGSGCTLYMMAYADRVVIEVKDCGTGFEIAPDVCPAAREERGRGIRLMRMLMDSVEIRRRRDAETGTCCRLIKLLD
ncbi:anti-sigma factor antagonist [Collinsella sp. zg1085]|uniref:anti-sigma factor antagonist n=1 Tax=Collinsella sp. zg1085 TaxID=2844380 RepID=UPI001C0DD645|nr:anti-sigma factor antagonist [Collinsella sp. zg1085]QWT18065.1 anti-sigma factor antagonist [Collinsella sp. zg1085]